MENSTTPIKAAFIGLITAKLSAMLGFDPASATTVATAVWLCLAAAVAYVVPADLGTRLGGLVGLIEKP